MLLGSPLELFEYKDLKQKALGHVIHVLV